MGIILLEFYWEKIIFATAPEQNTNALYQIYGVHQTNGPNNLLDVDKLMNYGRKNLLPNELSTLHFHSQCWYKKDDKEQKKGFDFSKHIITLN